MAADDLQTVAPDLDQRIRGAEAGDARRFAFRAARLACSLTGVHDRVALDIARGGLERPTEVDELVRLWRLERELAVHRECAEASAVSAVIAALKPDAVAAARGATGDALAAGCSAADLRAAAQDLL